MSDIAEDFTGRVALVTGGGSGIGREIALAYARRGGTVVVLGRRPEPLAETVAMVERLGQKASAEPCDVRDADAVTAVVDRVVERYGRLDALVNNAAGNFVAPAEKLSPNGWRAVVDIVLNGTFFCTRAAAAHMLPAGRGAVLNVIATYAWHGHPGTVHSAAAKAGVLAMTRTLAVEWAPYRIRVNALAPGPIDKTGGAAQLWPTQEAAERLRSHIPLGRFGEPEEVAHAAAYLVSDYASFITGECLVIDGGGWLGRNLFVERTPRG